jgi:hypothetical protein
LLNSNGSGSVSPQCLKVDALVNLIRDHTITVLVETRTSNVERLLDHLPGIGCFNTSVRVEGLKGDGIAVFVHSTIKDKVHAWRQPATGDRVLWLRVHHSVWGTAHDVMFGAAYVPPCSSTGTRDLDIADKYTAIESDIAGFVSQGLLVLLLEILMLSCRR